MSRRLRSGLRPEHQLFFAVMAILELKRSVRVSLTRSQMFDIGYRPDNFQSVSLAADRQGRLQAIMMTLSHPRPIMRTTRNPS